MAATLRDRLSDAKTNSEYSSSSLSFQLRSAGQLCESGAFHSDPAHTPTAATLLLKAVAAYREDAEIPVSHRLSHPSRGSLTKIIVRPDFRLPDRE